MFTQDDLNQLKWCLQAPIETVMEMVQPDRYAYITSHLPPNGPESHPFVMDGLLAYKDNGSNLLAVCHLDTVSDVGEFAVGDRGHIFASALDDRLGLYTMLFLMPRLTGVKFDWLFCDLEEIGYTTGAYADFMVDGDRYNWIVEFDRGGNDVVAYQYIDQALAYALSNVGYRIGMGSFTDITAMERLGRKAFNVGVGYYDAHNLNGYMVVEEYGEQMMKFVDFWDRFADVSMPHRHELGWFNDLNLDRGFRSWLSGALHQRQVAIWETGDLLKLHNTRYLPWKRAEEERKKANRTGNNSQAQLF